MPGGLNPRIWILGERLYLHTHGSETFLRTLAQQGFDYHEFDYQQLSTNRDNRALYSFMSEDNPTFARFMENAPFHRSLPILERIVFDPDIRKTQRTNWNYYGEKVSGWYPEMVRLLAEAQISIDQQAQTLNYTSSPDPKEPEPKVRPAKPRLKQNTRRFKARAFNSLALAIELFNRPHDKGRVEAVLMLLQHSFEMLLKAVIWQDRGRIADRGIGMSYLFTRCLGIVRSDLHLLDADEATTLAILDGFRDCATHNILTISEDNLYLHVQAGVSLFDALLQRAFRERLGDEIPNRVLPVSSHPPQDINVFLDSEFEQIRSLLAPLRRQTAEVHARLHPMMIMESNLNGVGDQPTVQAVEEVARRLRDGEPWRTIFPSAASLRLDTSGHGLSFSVRFTREPGVAPVRILRDDEHVEGVVPIREVNLLDRYSMGLRDLAARAGLSEPKTLAVAWHLDLQSDPECFKAFPVGRSTFKRYSPKALERLRAASQSLNLDDIWQAYQQAAKDRRAQRVQPNRKTSTSRASAASDNSPREGY